MADVPSIIAQLQVLSSESGCLLDLSAIIDLSICPQINILLPRPHRTEDNNDYVCVTPTEETYDRRSDEEECYEVSEQVCKKSTVALDIDLLVVLGLLSEHDLELYLRIIGAIGEHDSYECDYTNVKVNPLLSINIGSITLEIGGSDGLVNLDIGRKDGLSLDIGGKGGLLNLDLDEILHLDVGGKKDKEESLVDIDLFTKEKGRNPHDHYMTHYQPICKKGFKKEHYDSMEHCHAQDVNHCLALCHAHSALLTVNADVQVGDIAHIQLCAAIAFEDQEHGDNCHYMIAPETEPCHDHYLEDKDDCYSFIRN